MSKRFIFGLLCAVSLALPACGGRVARPTLVEQPFDEKLSCAHLAGELSNNAKRLVELEAERKTKSTNNAGLLITSPLFLDLSEVEREEAATILARNDRIRTLMTDKGCA